MPRVGYREIDRDFTAAVVTQSDSEPSEEHELGILETLGTVMRVRRDEALFQEGDAVPHYYKVVSGSLRSFKLLPDGRRHISDFFFAGDFIGVEALGSHGSTTEAVSNATLVRYDRRQIDLLIARSPRVGQFLLNRLCADLSEARARMLLLSRMSARERLARFLLRVGARSRRGDCDTISLPMTRSDIGDYLGLTAETVCRTFAELKSAGLIEALSSHEPRVLNYKDLTALAQSI